MSALNTLAPTLRSLVMAPLLLILSILDAGFRTLLIILEVEIPMTPDEIGKVGYGTVLLMIAFLLSTIFIAIGGRILGLSDMRIRVGVSISFFILVFVTLVIYDNLKRRLG